LQYVCPEHVKVWCDQGPERWVEMSDCAPRATNLCDGKPFWADLLIRRSAVDAWLGAKKKDELENFDWKLMETERENTEAVGIYELSGRPRRGILLLI
jgi:hypothetical protein